MQYKTHVLGGVGTAAVLAAVMPEAVTGTAGAIIAMSSGAVIGSLFPDIDHQNSYLGKRVKPISFLVRLAFGHRGVTHAPAVLLALTGGLLFISRMLGGGPMFTALLIGFLAGALSHVLLDALTPAGVPLLYPFKKKSVNLAGIRTGSFGETIFGVALAVAILWFGGVHLLPQFAG